MTERRTLFFEPLDVLQFRDYRSFDAGYSVLGQSIFPLPSVFLGCVRAALFRACKVNFHSDDEHYGLTDEQQWARDLLGGRTAPGALRLRGPLLARLDGGAAQPFFPMPADLARLEPDAGQDDDQVIAYARLQPRREHAGGPRCFHARKAMLDSVATDLPWSGKDVAKHDEPCLLTVEGARAYITGSDDRLELTSSANDQRGGVVTRRELIENENRFGIARKSSTLTTESHMFYLQRPLRLARNIGFAVDVEVPGQGPETDAVAGLDATVVQLGGKGHRARIHVLDQSLFGDLEAHAVEQNADVTECTIWFVSPMPVAVEGWPEGMDGVTERVQVIGGFDMARRAPRPLRRALPAGAIIRARGVSPEQALQALGGKEAENTYSYRQAGFGTALVIKDS